MSDLLRGHYDQSWLPDSISDRLERVQLDRAKREAILHLRGGARIVDQGDRIMLDGAMSPDATEEMAAAAARHGWHEVRITGSTSFRDSLTIALSFCEPPIPSDHQLSRQGQKDLTAERSRRAASAIPQRDQGELRRLAETDPLAAAKTQLADEQARCRAILAGRPTGLTDAAELAAPRLAELASKRQDAAASAREARDLAARHLAAHGRWASWMPTPAGRRQRALNTEANALTREADHLNKIRRREEKTVRRESERAAKANSESLADWTWHPSTAKAENRLAALDRVETELGWETPAVIEAAVAGDFKAAITAADKAKQQRHWDDREDPNDPQNIALDRLMRAERDAASDPELLSRLRHATAAAAAGDLGTIAAAQSGSLEHAMDMGAHYQRDRQRQQDEAKRQVRHGPEPEESLGYN